MATYGFEFEFSNLGFLWFGNGANPFNDGQNLFEIRSNLNGVIFDVKCDNWRNPQGNIHISILEVSSRPSRTVNDPYTPQDRLGIVRAFLEAVLGNLANNGNGQAIFVQNDQLNFNFGAEQFQAAYMVADPILLGLIGNINAVEGLSVSPQFTFGFDNIEFLEGFYRRYNPTVYYNNLSDFFQRTYGWCCSSYHYLPFSNDAENLFFSYFARNDMWRQRWLLIEFLRISIAFSINNVGIDQSLWMGNKAYMDIMSRKAFRGADGMFQNFILNNDDAIFILRTGSLDKLLQYVLATFDPMYHNRCPFTPMAGNDVMGYRGVGQNNKQMRNNIQLGYNNVMAANGITNFVRSTVTNDNQHVINGLQNVITTNFPMPLTQNQTTIYNNTAQYDYFSPVPFSEDNDPLGYYTRHGGQNVPRFLFEIRYASIILGGQGFYNQAFIDACTVEFDAALDNWP